MMSGVSGTEAAKGRIKKLTMRQVGSRFPLTGLLRVSSPSYFPLAENAKVLIMRLVCRARLPSQRAFGESANANIPMDFFF